MNNFKKTLEDQQKINDAVQAIFEHFSRWACYSEHIEVMSKAQTAIMVLTAHYHRLIEMKTDEIDETYHEDITQFICLVSQMMEILKPFADMLGQIRGNR